MQEKPQPKRQGSALSGWGRAKVLRSAVLLTVALGPSVLLAACGGSSSPSSSAAKQPHKALPPGLTKFGYPTVKSSTTLSPGKGTKVHSGHLTVLIPKGAVSTGATFELLEGSDSYWQAHVPAGQKVVANFAFRVVSTSTNKLITAFRKPIVVKVKSKAITSASKYWNTSPTNPPSVTVNPIPPKIKAHVLIHGNKVDPVGWLVTT